MKLTVRAAHLKDDRNELITFLHDNLTKDSNSIRFDWLYLGSPFGDARVWIGTDEQTGSTVGVAAAFPREFWIEGAIRKTWVLGDFCIAAQARSLGPALELQRACLAALEHEHWYDFPSQRMMAIYKRIGIPQSAEAFRFTKLLRIDHKVAKVVSNKTLVRTISAAGNGLLRLRTKTHAAGDMELTILDQPFGPEFDGFNSRGMDRSRPQGVRTADFLNWRYKHNPLQKFIVVVARRQSTFMGYLVVALRDSEAIVSDVQAVEEETTIPAMVSYLDSVLLESNVHTLNAPVLADPLLRQRLQACGFQQRESAPVVVHGGVTGLPTSAHSSNWLLFAGDRDS